MILQDEIQSRLMVKKAQDILKQAENNRSTIQTDTACFRRGDILYIDLYNSDGSIAKYKAKAINVTDTLITIRSLYWYELAWLWVNARIKGFP